MTKAEVVFKEELEYIDAKSIRDVVVKCFDELAADYFWDFTASSTQLHHPRVCNKKHGLVIHTKLCVWWARKFAQAFDQKNIDIAVASLLLHDIQKFGKILTPEGTPSLAEYSSTHGPLLAMQIEKLYSNVKVHEKTINDVRHIACCVAKHMGRFTDESLALAWTDYLQDLEGENDFTSTIVEFSNYASSREVDKKFKEFDNYKFPEM